jgi:hypothetical protein
MNNIHIVTVATHSDYYFPYLVKSCKKNNKELEVLGFDQRWKGFNWKFRLMIDYLKELKKNDIVCFVDGYDVICTRNLNELKEEFIKLRNDNNCKIIVGHDKIKKNFMSYFNNLYFGKCNDIKINTGTYIGYVYDLKIIIQKMYDLEPYNIADDQILMTKYCNLFKGDIYIDVDNKLFLTIARPFSEIDNLLTIRNNEIIYNKNKPFFLHAPGQTYLDNTIKLLGYKLNNDDIKYLMVSKAINRFIFLIIHNKYFYLILIIIYLNYLILFNE